MAKQTGLIALLAASTGLVILAPAANAASDLCRQLEAQRAGGSVGGGPAHLDQYDIAIAEQRQQLLLARDRTAEAGCSFSMVGAAVTYCARLNARIDQMEDNLDKLLRHRDRSSARNTKADDRLLALLAANGCDTGETAGKDANTELIEEIFGPENDDETALRPEAAISPPGQAGTEGSSQSIEAVAAPPPAGKENLSPLSPSIVAPETKTPPKPAISQPPAGISSTEPEREDAAPHQPDPDKKVRVVGPTFLPGPEAAIDLQAPAPRQVP
jgi:hypothetical protein